MDTTTTASRVDQFGATQDELHALTRLSLAPVSIRTALVEHLPTRLYELGFITLNAAGHLMLTDKGLALIRHQMP
ncbi:MAG TPA: hypothetical protein VE029_12200 [Rhizobacter sp.]|nr:hypothetical protein [Rhizobacter sp.]